MKCTTCNNNIQPDWKVCPFCEEEVQNNCKSCHMPLQKEWKACPHCRTKVLTLETASSQQLSSSSLSDPIQDNDTYFKCQGCGTFYLEKYRVEPELAICENCHKKEDSASTKTDDGHIIDRQNDVEFEADNGFELENESKDLEKEVRAKEVINTELQRVIVQQEIEAEEKKKRRSTTNTRLNLIPITNKLFANIHSGEFMMGSPECEQERDNSEKQHRVIVEGFQIMKTPVTFAQYEIYCKQTGTKVPDDSDWGRGGRPVVNVSYWEAVDFCEWLTNKSGKIHRLPTEAEWEYACRAGSNTAYSYGDIADNNKMYYLKCSTVTVAKFPSNSNGLYDMHGNVWEWCASTWDEDYKGKELLDTSSERGNNERRILRGGAYYCIGSRCRSASRLYLGPEEQFKFAGFRIVRKSNSS